MPHRNAGKVRQMKRNNATSGDSEYNDGYLDKHTPGGSGTHDAKQPERDDEKTVANPSPGEANP